MISSAILIPGLLVLNSIPLILLVFIRLKLAVTNIRSVFSYLIVAGMLWGNSTLLYRYDGWDETVRAFIIHVNFASAIVLANLFLVFFIQFTEQVALFRKPAFWILSGNTCVIAVLSFSDSLISSFEISPEKIRLHYGPLYTWFVISAVILEGYGMYLLIQSYRNARNELLRFQTKIVLKYALFTFALVLISNVAVPFLAKTSRYSFTGPFFALFFFLGVFRILFKGTRLYVVEILDKMLKEVPFQLQENILAVREFIQALKAAVLSPGEKSLRQIQFAGSDGQLLSISVGKNSISDKPVSAESGSKAGVIPQKWLTGFYDTLHLLQTDNRHLALALLKAESVIQGDWLTEFNGNLPERMRPAPEGSYCIKDFLPAVEKNIRDHRETYGVTMCAMSRAMFKQLSIATEYAAGNQWYVIEGESGTGKATLARAIHNYRLKPHELIEVSCQNANMDALTKRIEAIASLVQGGKTKRGILIRNLDFVPLNMVSVFSPLFNLDQEKAFLYITSAPDYLRNLEDASEALFHKLNQVRIEVPPLRRREEDLFHLIVYFTVEYATAMNINFTHISQSFMANARSLAWQGNIVELKNTIQREVLNNLPPILDTLHLTDSLALAAPGEVLTPLERAERKVILDFLRKNNFNKNRTRTELNITVNTLNAKIRKYGIELPA